MRAWIHIWTERLAFIDVRCGVCDPHDWPNVRWLSVLQIGERCPKCELATGSGSVTGFFGASVVIAV